MIDTLYNHSQSLYNTVQASISKWAGRSIETVNKAWIYMENYTLLLENLSTFQKTE